MDAEGVREIQDRFDAASDGSVPILVDLSGITFMDSLGVALLVRLAKRLKSFSVPMAVIPGPGPVARILGLARIDKILNVVFTREDAWTVLRLSPPA
jgi:anti-anti-sigma factor